MKVPKKTVLCPDCNERIKGGKFARHVREHHTEEKFACSQCSKKFKRNEGLNIHKQKSCKRDQNLFPFICMCGEPFKTERKLKNYQKDSRFCVKKTMCEKCNLKFPTIKDLKDHTFTCQTETEEDGEQDKDDGHEGEAMGDLEDHLDVEAEVQDNPHGDSDNPDNAPDNASVFDNVILDDTGIDDLDYDEVVRNVGNISFSF